MDTNSNLQNESENKEKEATTRSLVKEFCEYTTCGGLGRVVASRYLVFRIVWSLLVLGALCYATYLIYGLYLKYEERPVVTTMKIRNNAALKFPSITFCNLNPILKSKIKNIPGQAREEMDQFVSPNKTFDQIDQKESESAEKSRRRREISSNATSSRKRFTASKQNKIEGEVDEDLPDPSQLRSEYRVKERIYAQLAQLTHEELEPLGHGFDESLLSCTFRGVSCSNFTLFWQSFWHYKYGNCFIFNSGRNEGRGVMRSSKAGPLHGLDMELYVNQEEYVDQLSQEAGYRIVISPQGVMPFPYEEGISVTPGLSTSVGIRKVVIIRADPFKNGSCAAFRGLERGNLYRNEYNASYSAMACRESCLAYNQLFRCGCMEYRFPNHKLKVCDPTNSTTVGCLRRLYVQYQNNDLNCSKECPKTCNEKYFKTSSSSAAWPSRNYEAYLKREYHIEDSVDTLRQEILKVKIFYEELNYQEIKESVSYGMNEFLSDIGGQLGLWLGVSVLTGVEVVELIFMIFLNCCQPKKNKAATGPNDHEMRAKVGKPHKHPFA